MKHGMKYLVLICCLGLFTSFMTHAVSAKQGPPKTPPGLAKKDGLPPGQAKKQENAQGLPPGIAKQQGLLPTDEFEQELRQAWCLEREGTVNLVLPDKTICECLTQTHAIAFASEDSWFEAVGKSLHVALTTGKEPAIVLFLESEETPAYAFQLNAVIKQFELPIFLWEEVIEIEEETP